MTPETSRVAAKSGPLMPFCDGGGISVARPASKPVHGQENGLSVRVGGFLRVSWCFAAVRAC